ncbi:CDK-activating kinase assembly factor MAT1 [Allomyces macrogynus ATCC 38327]|uniref:RNA polymerase II transcription factor B subunit 3 n=2 Tax=Allomyces macrogynus (strain ATCC 38327) TaxID=578462 RepID=A0A0L0T8G5_ALLM3|nr:CDK-activating kinase assembly factor MAT1 [Allomyces macrogynus ATCC 38327]|eukprot:KNE71005.1 CDK-activating kinase assembly factor MAT1 [Allomyces macrogynus ATCC 38327]
MDGTNSEEVTCQVCKFSRYLKPNLKILVSKCNHRICEECIGRVFKLGKAPCPICGTDLRKQDVIAPVFENLMVDKEVRERRRALRVFNKRREDFATLREYNDFLEMVEDVVFNLVHDVDVEATMERMRKFQRENHDQIAINTAKLNREVEAQKAFVEQEQQQRLAARAEQLRRRRDEEQAEQSRAEAILNEMATPAPPMPHFPITVSHPYAHSHPYAPAHVAIPSPWAMSHHAHHNAYAPPVYSVPPMHAAPAPTGAADALARDLRAMLRIDVPMP